MLAKHEMLMYIALHAEFDGSQESYMDPNEAGNDFEFAKESILSNVLECASDFSITNINCQFKIINMIL